jgi:acetyl-CoA acetyltransferase
MESIKGKAAVIGIGESTYYKHGTSPAPAFKLCLNAIQAACSDAGVHPRKIDGFVSFASEASGSMRVAAALGVDHVNWSSMPWGGGGGGGSAAVQQAAAAIACGFAEYVVVYRSLVQSSTARFGQHLRPLRGRSLYAPYGLDSPATLFAPIVNRFFHDSGVSQETQRAVAMASYYHAQRNPRAVMNGKPLTSEQYENARWITEPFRLYDCCQETDGAAAMVMVSAERARDLVDKPVYLLSAWQGSGYRGGGIEHAIFDSARYATAEFDWVARRLFDTAGVAPGDVSVTQAYENFTGGTVMALIEHGLCSAADANDTLTFENLIAPAGLIPLNTSGGNMAEGYIHGMALHLEAVRQLQGRSSSQVPGARVGLVASGPMVAPTSDALYGTAEALG